MREIPSVYAFFSLWLLSIRPGFGGIGVSLEEVQRMTADMCCNGSLTAVSSTIPIKALTLTSVAADC